MFHGCKKEDNVVSNFDESIKLVTLYADDSPLKTTSSVTLLEFTSVEHYEATITMLQNQLEQYLDEFL
jgi:hypothetical protein